MKNIPLLLGTILGSILLIVAIGFFFSQSSQGGQEAQAVSPELLAQDARHIQGATESAQLQIVEFSDFQCPACLAAKPAIDAVVSQYGDKVQFIYKHFPLDSIHPNARDAAIASEVASQSDKFWEMHELLFNNQNEWANIASRDELYQKFSEYAEQLQLDKQEFIEKIKENQEARDLVQKDVDLGKELKINSTPTIYVDGQQVSAPQLLQVVSAALQKSSNEQQ